MITETAVKTNKILQNKEYKKDKKMLTKSAVCI